MQASHFILFLLFYGLCNADIQLTLCPRGQPSDLKSAPLRTAWSLQLGGDAAKAAVTQREEEERLSDRMPVTSCGPRRVQRKSHQVAGGLSVFPEAQ